MSWWNQLLREGLLLPKSQCSPFDGDKRYCVRHEPINRRGPPPSTAK